GESSRHAPRAVADGTRSVPATFPLACTSLGERRACGCTTKHYQPLLRLGELREALAAERLTQFQQPARLDLADALAGDAVGPRHLFQRLRLAIAQAETHLD